MGRTCRSYVDTRNLHRILMGKALGRLSLGNSMNICQDES